MEIKILGSGCPSCKKLEKNTKEAIKELGTELKIEKVTEIQDIMSYGVMSTPALVIDGKVKSFGRILKKEEIVEIIKSI